jgi:lysyl-tRNA synthetase class 2
MQADWRPVTTLRILKLRAELLARVRAYFSDNAVLEVDTPVLSAAAATDPALHSFTTDYHGPGVPAQRVCYLHTSPEFPMKRLLAAGSGSIYQICKVFRDAESGRLHNPEFTLLEWYRTGLDHLDLMDDVERLLTVVLDGIAPIAGVQHWTYRDLFREFAAVDPFRVSARELAVLLESRFGLATAGMPADQLDAWLDLTMTHVIQPRLGRGLVFVRDYPASQAALARLRPGSPPVAARFEVYLDGVELANGFHELADAAEQRRRFMAENRRRTQAGDRPLPVDEYLLAALAAGFPDCAGVALGLDRLLMIAAGADSLREVMSFPFDVA